MYQAAVQAMVENYTTVFNDLKAKLGAFARSSNLACGNVSLVGLDSTRAGLDESKQCLPDGTSGHLVAWDHGNRLSDATETTDLMLRCCRVLAPERPSHAAERSARVVEGGSRRSVQRWSR